MVCHRCRPRRGVARGGGSVKAAVLEAYREPLVVRERHEPAPPANGAVVRVEACGVCRSDWHAWVGDWAALVELPRVLGHELSGMVEAVGPAVTQFKVGDRVAA